MSYHSVLEPQNIYKAMREQQPQPTLVTDEQITKASNQIRELLTQNPALIQTALNFLKDGSGVLLSRDAAGTALSALPAVVGTILSGVPAVARASLPGSVKEGAMGVARGARGVARGLVSVIANPFTSVTAAAGATMSTLTNIPQMAMGVAFALPIIQPILSAWAQGQLSLLLQNKALQDLVTSPMVLDALATGTASETVANAMLKPGRPLAHVASLSSANKDLSALILGAAGLGTTSERALFIRRFMVNQAVLLNPDSSAEAKKIAVSELVKATAGFAQAPELAEVVERLMANQAILSNAAAAPKAKSAARLKSADDIAALLSSELTARLLTEVSAYRAFIIEALKPIVGKYIDPAGLVELVTNPGIRADLAETLRAYSKGETTALLRSPALMRMVASPALREVLSKPPAPSTIATAVLASTAIPPEHQRSLTELVSAGVQSMSDLPYNAFEIVSELMGDRQLSIDPKATGAKKNAAVKRMAGNLATLLHSSQASIVSLSATILANRDFVENVLTPIVGPYVSPSAFVGLITDPYTRTELASAFEAYSRGGTSALLADRSTHSLLTSPTVLDALSTPPAPRAIAEVLLKEGGALAYVTEEIEMDWSADGLPREVWSGLSALKSLEALVAATAISMKAPEVASIVKSLMSNQAILLDPAASKEAKSTAFLLYTRDILSLLGSPQAADLSKAVQESQEFVAVLLEPILGKFLSPVEVAKLAADPAVCADLSIVVAIYAQEGATALFKSKATQRLFMSPVVLGLLSTPPTPGVIADTLLGGALKHVPASPEAKASLAALITDTCTWMQDKDAGLHMNSMLANLAIFLDEKSKSSARTDAGIKVAIDLLEFLSNRPKVLDNTMDWDFIAKAMGPYVKDYVNPNRVVELLKNREQCGALVKALTFYKEDHTVKAIAVLCVEAINNKNVRWAVASAIGKLLKSVFRPSPKKVPAVDSKTPGRTPHHRESIRRPPGIGHSSEATSR